ncbi:MAG: DUF6321 domain-containing protein [Bdellovibrionia bacterium]
MPDRKRLQNPQGGLTPAGREYFKKTQGAHLKPGVRGPADTPDKMQRKGSFLRRFFLHPRGPLKDKKGRATRLALSAQAWGEPVPQTPLDTKRLARKGKELLGRVRELFRRKKASPAAKANGTYTHPELREKIKAQVMKSDKGGKPGQWSARKAQLVALEYKRQGGKYQSGKKAPQKNLDRWTNEDWTTVNGKRARQPTATSRYLPRKAWEQLNPAERRSTDRKKQIASRTGKQFVPNTTAARRARKSSSSS